MYFQYEVKGKPKVSVYWLAELANPETPVILSHEHKAFEWLGVDEACKKANFQDMQELLQDCQAYLDKKWVHYYSIIYSILVIPTEFWFPTGILIEDQRQIHLLKISLM